MTRLTIANTTVAQLPRDSALVELRPELITFQTRQCLLPGTTVRFRLLMEGQPLALQAPVAACLVIDRDRSGFVYHARLSLDRLSEPDRHLIALFIDKGRGRPVLEPPAEAR